MADAAVIPFPRASTAPRPPRTYSSEDLAMLATYFERLAAISEAEGALRAEGAFPDDRFHLGEAAAFRSAAATVSAVVLAGGAHG